MTRALAQSYVERDRRIRLLGDGRASEGVSAARNRGIAEATSDWLLFLDSDDWIEPAFLQKMLAVLAALPGARVAYSACRRVSPNGHAGPLWLSSEVARAPFEVLARQCPVVIHGFLIDRTLIDEIGGFDPALRTCEDWDFWHRLARTGVVFHPVADAVAYYRLRARSLSSDAHAMLADARIVIDRAFAADPRVRHPAPRHAEGADPGLGTKETSLGHFALWCAAFDVGDGGRGTDLVLPLPDSGGNIAETCRVTILAGLRARARIQPDEPLSQDAAFIAAVRDLLHQVERAAGRPGLARQLEHMLEPDLFRPGHLTARLVIERTLLVRQDATHLTAVDVPPEVDSLQAEFRLPGREPGWIEVPVFASLSRREVAELAIDALSLGAFVEGHPRPAPSAFLGAARGRRGPANARSRPRLAARPARHSRARQADRPQGHTCGLRIGGRHPERSPLRRAGRRSARGGRPRPDPAGERQRRCRFGRRPARHRPPRLLGERLQRTRSMGLRLGLRAAQVSSARCRCCRPARSIARWSSPARRAGSA